MIKAFSSYKFAFNCLKATSFIASNRIINPYSSKIHKLYQFSQSKQRVPKSKQQAWMMQEQKLMSSEGQSQQSAKTYEGFSKIGILAFAVMFGGLVYIVHIASERSKQNLDFFQEEISGLKQLKDKQSLIGGDWTLVDSEGRPFSNRMLSGYYYLIYFGYTRCPDITPSTLFYLSSVYRIIRNLPEGAYLKFKVVFVSIDPQRDTPKAMKEYLGNFGKNLIGVTGSGPNDLDLKECLKKFKIHTKKIQKPTAYNPNDYLIDSTARVFLMDPDNKYLYHLDPSLSEQQTAKAILTKIISNEHMKEKISQKLPS